MKGYRQRLPRARWRIDNPEEFCAGNSRSDGCAAHQNLHSILAGYDSAWVMEFIWKLLRIRMRPLLTTYTVLTLVLDSGFY